MAVREAITITEAHLDDAPALARIERDSPEVGQLRLRVSPVQDYFAIDRATPGMRALVARDADGRPIGTVSFQGGHAVLGNGPATVAYHSRLRVAPESRRQGVATALLRTAAARAEREGAAISWGAILAGNDRALATCRAAGYHLVGELEARILPVRWLAILPTSRRYAAWLAPGGNRPGALRRGQLAALGTAAPDVQSWGLIDPIQQTPIAGLSTRDLSRYWRLAVGGGPAWILYSLRCLTRLGWLPDTTTGLRLTVAGGGWVTGYPRQSVRALLLGLCRRLEHVCDILVVITDPRSAFSQAIRGVPSLRSTLWLVAQPPGLLDLQQPFDAFAY